MDVPLIFTECLNSAGWFSGDALLGLHFPQQTLWAPRRFETSSAVTAYTSAPSPPGGHRRIHSLTQAPIAQIGAIPTTLFLN